MFRGRFVHTIDSKNRMSLPAGYRQEFQRRSDHPPILTYGHNCLELHPFEDWQVYEEQILSLATIDPEAQDYVRTMLPGATECPIDKQGRILVPRDLRDYAALERDVTIAGMGPKIELWNSARYTTKFNQTQARFPEISRSLAAKLGNLGVHKRGGSEVG